MKNFIFKSSEKDLHKICVQLNLLLSEQRCQRVDLARIYNSVKNRHENPQEDIVPDVDGSEEPDI